MSRNPTSLDSCVFCVGTGCERREEGKEETNIMQAKDRRYARYRYLKGR